MITSWASLLSASTTLVVLPLCAPARSDPVPRLQCHRDYQWCLADPPGNVSHASCVSFPDPAGKFYYEPWFMADDATNLDIEDICDYRCTCDTIRCAPDTTTTTTTGTGQRRRMRRSGSKSRGLCMDLFHDAGTDECSPSSSDVVGVPPRGGGIQIAAGAASSSSSSSSPNWNGKISGEGMVIISGQEPVLQKWCADECDCLPTPADDCSV
ncbi:MAG: hypothetical protein M1837_005292 [Sclerophora amabilis]|nr:MAG: hypothetical protein M1837_005292 [Sclerophora amabilis]